MKTKKGISPVIATTMLIGLVIVLGIIIALWFASMAQESIVKFERNIDLVCGDVSFSVNSMDDGYLEISNTGTIPIYDFNVIAEGDGYSETFSIDEIYSGMGSNGLEQGSLVSLEKTASFPAGVDKITIIPILMGTSSEGGRKSYECGESNGKNVIF